MWLNALNIALYQLVWWSVVLAGEQRWALILTGTVLILHFILFPQRSEWLTVGIVTLLGSSGDSVLALCGVFGEPFARDGIPLWLILLWAAFATLLNHSLRWLRGRWLLAIVLGALGGALSYWSGAQLGAIPPLALTDVLVIAGYWAIFTPLMFALAAVCERRSVAIPANKN